jgi:hypothetical protein
MRSYIIFSVLIIAGLLFHLIQTTAKANSFWYNTFGNVANTLLVGGTLSLLYNSLIKKSEETKMLTLLQISSSVRNSGLLQIKTNSADYRFAKLLHSAKKFSAVMNDGQRWVGNHSQEIEERFNKVGTLTEFFFVDPNGDFCSSLAIKVGASKESLQEKIRQTISLIESAYERSSQEGILRIYFLKNYPTQSIFLTEKKVVVTPYRVASGRTIIPLFEYSIEKEKNSIGYRIWEDIENLRKESQFYTGNT